jgi:hypothetical protein
MNKEQEFLVQKAQDSLRAAKILADENLLIERTEEFLELVNYLSSC